MKTIIKKICVALGFIFILSLTSCQEKTSKIDEQESKISEEIQNIEARNDSLEQIYIAILNEIDENLDNIRDEQGYLVLGKNSNADIEGVSKKEQILNNIAMINDLLEVNKSKIASLETSLSKYKKGKESLINELSIAKEQLYTQELQIAEMKKLLEDKDFNIAELNQIIEQNVLAIQSLSANIEAGVNELNKTYYTSGTFKQLKEKSIVEKEGGLLGIRGVKVLCEDLNKLEFTEMDKSKNTTIEMSGRNPKIITRHPEGTYKFESKTDESSLLTINDPENFWKISKYLVVEVH